MSKHNARFDYPKNDYHIVFQSSINDDEYYGMMNWKERSSKLFSPNTVAGIVSILYPIR
jgi:hypothetical protein